MSLYKNIILIMALVVSGLGPWAGANAQEKTYTFAVVPQQSASKLARLWGPILAHVSRTTGYRINFVTAPTIPDFEERLKAGEYDFAYMNPYHYTVFSDAPGYQAFGKATDKKIKGIVVVRKDSPIKDISELAGAKLAFPAPAAFAATVLPQSYFRQQGIDFTPSYVSSHDSVYLSVAKGLFPAGGGVVRTFRNMDPEIASQLKVLWTTDGFTPHAFASHPNLDPAVREAVANAMVDMVNSEEGKTLLESIKIKGVTPAGNADWDDVRDLNIELIK